MKVEGSFRQGIRKLIVFGFPLLILILAVFVISYTFQNLIFKSLGYLTGSFLLLLLSSRFARLRFLKEIGIGIIAAVIVILHERVWNNSLGEFKWPIIILSLLGVLLIFFGDSHQQNE